MLSKKAKAKEFFKKFDTGTVIHINGKVDLSMPGKEITRALRERIKEARYPEIIFVRDSHQPQEKAKDDKKESDKNEDDEPGEEKDLDADESGVFPTSLKVTTDDCKEFPYFEYVSDSGFRSEELTIYVRSDYYQRWNAKHAAEENDAIFTFKFEDEFNMDTKYVECKKSFSQIRSEVLAQEDAYEMVALLMQIKQLATIPREKLLYNPANLFAKIVVFIRQPFTAPNRAIVETVYSLSKSARFEDIFASVQESCEEIDFGSKFSIKFLNLSNAEIKNLSTLVYDETIELPSSVMVLAQAGHDFPQIFSAHELATGHSYKQIGVWRVSSNRSLDVAIYFEDSLVKTVVVKSIPKLNIRP